MMPTFTDTSTVVATPSTNDIYIDPRLKEFLAQQEAARVQKDKHTDSIEVYNL